MNDNLEKDVSDILTGTHTKNSGEVTAVIERAKAEIPKVEAELATHEAAENDMAITGSALDEAIQRTAATRRHLNRLKGSVSRLADTRDKLMLAERDEWQKADYALLVKQRAACKSEIAELIERIPSFARLLHRVVELEKAATRFNNPPPPHVLANPQDLMVSQYPHLPPLVPEHLRKGLRLVDAAGTVLYAHVDTSTVSVPPAVALQPRKGENFAAEKEAVRQARETQLHANTILRGLEHEAEARGISIEQAATVEGFDVEDIPRWQDQANGKAVAAAQAAFKKARDKVLEDAKKSTS
ncbi:hypothetical protein [Pseudotabrizicola sp. 4114]|uniref:hypothetical protein n=1 Tax=Pseudotabrizicola sp. 4114 TaxID=2817731 RepID=UPI0028669C07|nr:hypothetical protein [Pseudorhodobacter sp. 4114]